MTALTTLQELQTELLETIAQYGNGQPPESLVRQLRDVNQAIGGAGEGVTVERTPHFLITDAQGQVPAGAQAVSFFNSGTANGTVLGQTLVRGLSVAWSVVGSGDTLSAIAYDATGTSFVITWVT